VNTTDANSTLNETQIKGNTVSKKDNTSTTQQTQAKGTRTKVKKTKTIKTIREKAIAKAKLKPEVIQKSAARYNARLAAATIRTMTPQELAELQVAEEYQREEKTSHIVRLTQVLLEGGEFLPPILVAVRANEDGSTSRYIVDGQQRRRALVEAGLPQVVIEVPFESVGDEKSHFLGIQRGMAVNTSHIVAVSDDEIAAEIRRIANLDGVKGHIFLGKGRRQKSQIPAKSVENLVKRFGLKLEKLEQALRVLFAAFEDRDIPASAITSAMLRGYIGFYQAFESKLNPNDQSQMTTLHGILTASRKFPRRGDNSKSGGQSCQTIIRKEFERCQAA